jgi:hypothetical protein
MLGLGTLARLRPATRQEVRGHGPGRRPGELHGSSTNTPGVQADHGVDIVERDVAGPAAQHQRRDSSGGYLGYLLCAAGRPDLLTTRHLHDRLPPEMPPMC